MNISRLFILIGLLFCTEAAWSQEVEQTEDLGRLPESFSMETDSLLNARYREYYSYSKKNAVPKSDAKSSDELYRSRLRAMESAIPLPYNDVVREAIELYVGGRGALISKMLARSAMYFPIIEEELDRQRLPLELKYLSIVESALNPSAVSRAGATGLWQFMLRTGKIYGLHIDSLVDERMDPQKSTRAMAAYFKDLYGIYGDWLLAIAAYNCGPGNVNKAIQRAGEGRKSFWDVYRFLPRETRSYVPFFIAAYYAMEHYEEHDINPSLVRLPLATDTVHVNRRLTFRDISHAINIPVEQIEELNPAYKKDIIPGNNGTMVLTLPTAYATAFVEKMPALASAAKETYEEAQKEAEEFQKQPPKEKKTKKKAPSKRYYKVKKGDTLIGIARRYKGVTVNEIRRANGIRGNNIKPGQRLVIPR